MKKGGQPRRRTEPNVQPVRSDAGASVIVRRPPGTACVHAAAPLVGRGPLPSSSPTSASALLRDAGGLTYA